MYEEIKRDEIERMLDESTFYFNVTRINVENKNHEWELSISLMARLGVSLHVEKADPSSESAPPLVISDSEPFNQLLDQMDTDQKTQFKAQIQTILANSSFQFTHGFADREDEAHIGTTEKVEIEKRIYPQQLTKQKLMDSIFEVATTTRCIDDAGKARAWSD